MSLFLRRRTARTRQEPPIVPGLAADLVARGWQPVSGTPFDGHLEDKVHEVSLAMYGVPRGTNTAQRGIRIGGTVFRDAFRARLDGRDVVVANGWTEIETEVQYAPVEWHGAAVCAVVLPAALPLVRVQSRRLNPQVLAPPVRTGDERFDATFVTTVTPAGLPDVVTPEVRGRMLARDDWSFVFERYWLGCLTRQAFGNSGEVLERVEAVLSVVDALPSAIAPAPDDSIDDLMTRVDAVTGIDEAMDLLQNLTDDERARLATSGSALAAFADVRTPEEALGRLRTLPPMQRMQLMGLFMRVRDQRRE